MSDNIIHLRQADITPATVIKSLQDSVDKIDAIYVVTIENGTPRVFASGNLSDMALASMVLSAVTTETIFDPEKFTR